MPTRNVNLTEALDAFVERAVASGRYGNASEVVRDALRRMSRSLDARLAPDGMLREGDALPSPDLADDPSDDSLDGVMDRLSAEAMAAALGEAWDEGLASGPMGDGAEAMARLRARLAVTGA